MNMYKDATYSTYIPDLQVIGIDSKFVVEEQCDNSGSYCQWNNIISD